MRMIGQNPTEAEVQDLVNTVDMDGTGDISFPEFLQIMAIKNDQEILEMQISEAFRTFDQVSSVSVLFEFYSEFCFQDGSGYVSRQELSTVMTHLGMSVTQEEIEVGFDNVVAASDLDDVQGILDEADVDGDGQINYTEFYNLMTNTN